jgi:hypothetical protein
MFSTIEGVHTLDDLRRFVHALLCEKENLLPDQFRTSEVTLIRQNEPCGLQFCLRGPRSVRLAAVWAADHNVVYLYDAKGTRYSKLPLAHRLSLPPSLPDERSKVA